MKNFLITDYPAGFVVFCLLLGLGYAFILYRKDTFITPKALKYLLFACRSLVVALIAFFLLVPIIRKKNLMETKPVLVYVEDNSLSVKEYTDKSEFEAYRIKSNELLDKLGKKFTIKKFLFGEGIQTRDEPDYTDKITNISKSLRELQKQLINNRVGGVILATDGIYNEGSNPLYESENFKASFYTIGLGDTSVRKDFKIAQLRYNNIVYQGDIFQVEIDVAAYNLQGKSGTLQVYNAENQLIYSEKIELNSDNFFSTIRVNIEAKTVGVTKYRFSLTVLEGEVTAINNTAWAYVDVMEGKQRILLLYDAPHPDIKALARMVEGQKNYEFKAERISRFKENVSYFDCIILHGLPSSNQSLASLVGKISDLNVWYIVSNSTDIALLNSYQKVLQINAKSNQKNEAFAYLNNGFNTFILNENTSSQLGLYPPLMTPFGDFAPATDAAVLLYQKIGSVESGYPLLVLGNKSGVKSAILAGEGIWRWFVSDNKEFEERAYYEIFSKVIRFMSLKEDKRKFRLNIPQNVLGENKNVTMTAELYNENLEPVVSPDVSVVLKSEDGKEYLYTMDKGSAYYNLNAGKLPVGDYSIQAFTRFNNQELKASVKLSIEPVQVEQVNTQANHDLLRTMAKATGGAFVNMDDVSSLEDLILNDIQMKPVISESFQIKPLLDLKWLFFLILSLLTIEWIARKWLGTY